VQNATKLQTTQNSVTTLTVVAPEEEDDSDVEGEGDQSLKLALRQSWV